MSYSAHTVCAYELESESTTLLTLRCVEHNTVVGMCNVTLPQDSGRQCCHSNSTSYCGSVLLCWRNTVWQTNASPASQLAVCFPNLPQMRYFPILWPWKWLCYSLYLFIDYKLHSTYNRFKTRLNLNVNVSDGHCEAVGQTYQEEKRNREPSSYCWCMKMFYRNRAFLRFSCQTTFWSYDSAYRHHVIYKLASKF